MHANPGGADMGGDSCASNHQARTAFWILYNVRSTHVLLVDLLFNESRLLDAFLYWPRPFLEARSIMVVA
jgi:hypothetical protein